METVVVDFFLVVDTVEPVVVVTVASVDRVVTVVFAFLSNSFLKVDPSITPVVSMPFALRKESIALTVALL